MCKLNIMFWTEIDKFYMQTIRRFFQDEICMAFLDFQFIRTVFLALVNTTWSNVFPEFFNWGAVPNDVIICAFVILCDL